MPQEQILLLPLLASKGCYPLPTCFLAVTECLVVAKHHCLKVRIINRLRYVLQVLPSSLLGAVRVCHNAHKQQILQTSRIKCSFKAKTKRPSFAAPFWIHFEPRFEPLGWCAILIKRRRPTKFALVVHSWRFQ